MFRGMIELAGCLVEEQDARLPVNCPCQQQPLRPGSAQTRLADALGVPELRPGDPPARDSGDN